jgi:type VI secretion system protein ImpH
MAAARRNTRAPVVEELREGAYAFDFFQVVRILEAMAVGASPVGTGSDPSLEAVRFRSDPSLAFPASEIVDVRLGEFPEEPAEVVVSFLGLAGEQGPLPRPFTELILRRIADRDTAARDFLDIFNHRLVSLLYRAREKHRVGLRIQPPEESRLADIGFALVGLGASPLRDRMGFADRSLLFYAGTLSQGRRTAVGLEGLLAAHFHAVLGARSEYDGGVHVREFVGRWHALELDQGTALGAVDGHRELGVDAVLGHRVWDQLGMIEVVLGPLDLESFQRFLPGGDALEPLRDMVTFYLRGDVDFVIRLVLRAEDVPATVLTAGSGAARLGLTSWLKTRPFRNDAADIVLGPRSSAPTV